ncbi:MAG: phosphoribosylamine--glycine ligase [Elusimicrobiota bacterium]
MNSGYNISPRRVLVVGSWAKGQITIENIKRNPAIKVFSYLSTENPAIISMADGYKIGKLSHIESISEYAIELKVDMVIVTTASPLSMGLADYLREKGVFVFGPSREASKLESDKAFTRNFMKEHRIKGLPEFKVFTHEEKAVEYARQMNWNVAVKPSGLTEGLGVKVFKEQLKDKSRVVEYIKKILSGKGENRVIIEEKLEGEEFALQCFIYDSNVIPVWAVRDFKKRNANDTGPNTASMGSYSCPGKLLPFMQEKDYRDGLQIIKETLGAFNRQHSKPLAGFLYGQFMICKSGIKLIEYNFRPGDPEWINTLLVLKDNIVDIIKSLVKGEKKELSYQPLATVCKYVVPPEYPQKLNQILELEVPEKKINREGVKLYYSCGMSQKGKYNVGSERGILFAAKDRTVAGAGEKIERAISLLKGRFHHREDIGMKEMAVAGKNKLNA